MSSLWSLPKVIHSTKTRNPGRRKVRSGEGGGGFWGLAGPSPIWSLENSFPARTTGGRSFELGDGGPGVPEGCIYV
jgi:hypothetical protein